MKSHRLILCMRWLIGLLYLQVLWCFCRAICIRCCRQFFSVISAVWSTVTWSHKIYWLTTVESSNWPTSVWHVPCVCPSEFTHTRFHLHFNLHGVVNCAFLCFDYLHIGSFSVHWCVSMYCIVAQLTAVCSDVRFSTVTVFSFFMSV